MMFDEIVASVSARVPHERGICNLHAGHVDICLYCPVDCRYRFWELTGV